ncbi:BsuPI-related putative proteinase inhibitor [Bacillus sp. 2205SS5-2]|uniref:BsuPI-related putative proteinase inhibitor n=1 Tax=Bacillus sp. 2205SS5-2 TaxID=3109031 RepID=UPI00300785A5
MKKWVCFMLLCTSLFSTMQMTYGMTKKELQWSVEGTVIGEEMKITLSLQNKSSSTYTFQFPTSQMFDYCIYNEQNQKVYRHSDGKRFLQSLHTLTLKPGQSKVWTSVWQMRPDLPGGDYSIIASFLPTKPKAKDSLQTNYSFKVDDSRDTFRNLKVLVKGKGQFEISGEAKTREGSFYYTVEDGHDVLVEETLVKVNKKEPSWTQFVFIVTETESWVGNDNAILMLYERDQANGTPLNQFTIKLHNQTTQ